MGIYSLINQDPQKARQVTADFTDYLRKNFKAVAGNSTIPFARQRAILSKGILTKGPFDKTA